MTLSARANPDGSRSESPGCHFDDAEGHFLVRQVADLAGRRDREGILRLLRKQKGAPLDVLISAVVSELKKDSAPRKGYWESWLTDVVNEAERSAF